MTLRSDALATCEFQPPSIDLSCGDGVFSFLHADGAFDPDFDVFTSVAQPDPSHAHQGDMFNHLAQDYQPTIVRSPAQQIDVGTDIKSALLEKARRLHFYGRLFLHDNNQPLPFDDHRFATLYCNAAYWVHGIERFLRDFRRITRPGGSIILQVKLDSMKRYSLAGHRGVVGKRVLDILGNRTKTWPSLASRSTWESRFEKAGLTIKRAMPFVTKTHALMWNVGLRPIAPLLVRMTRALSPATRAAIKRDWVDLFRELLEPLCDPSFDLYRDDDEPAEIQYVLTPSAAHSG